MKTWIASGFLEEYWNSTVLYWKYRKLESMEEEQEEKMIRQCSKWHQ